MAEGPKPGVIYSHLDDGIHVYAVVLNVVNHHEREFLGYFAASKKRLGIILRVTNIVITAEGPKPLGPSAVIWNRSRVPQF
jgi:hypothetical protein